MDLQAWIDSLPDVAVVNVFDDLVQALTDQLSIDVETLIASTPAELAREPAFKSAIEQAKTNYHVRLSPAASVAIARDMLSAIADSPMAPVLATVAQGYRDKQQFALEVLALGAAVSMVLMTCTLTFAYRH